MNPFFTGLCGWRSLREWVKDETPWAGETSDAPRGKIRLITCFGMSRNFEIPFEQFALVDGVLWRPAALQRYLGIKSKSPARVFVVFCNGNFLFAVWGGREWLFYDFEPTSFSEFTNFTECPREWQTDNVPFGKNSAIGLQKQLERTTFSSYSITLLQVRK